jgi:hypothetical protein
MFSIFKPRNKPENKPENKPRNKPENKPENKPRNKPENKPENFRRTNATDTSLGNPRRKKKTSLMHMFYQSLENSV